MKYKIDDWLVIRTDEEGHNAVLVTEDWPEWGAVGLKSYSSGIEIAQAETRVIARAKLMPEFAWQERSCKNGWCSACAR